MSLSFYFTLPDDIRARCEPWRPQQCASKLFGFSPTFPIPSLFLSRSLVDPINQTWCACLSVANFDSCYFLAFLHHLSYEAKPSQSPCYYEIYTGFVGY